MGRVAVLWLVLLALTAQAGFGASGPKWTATGAITALRVHSITVHGQTCRITTASPVAATLRLYYVGAEAKIACANGVLRSIDTLHSQPMIKSSMPVQTGSGGGGNFTWVAPICGRPPNGQDTYVGIPPTVTCASGTVAAFGPVSSGDLCGVAFGVGQPASNIERLCASVTVGSFTCGIEAFFYASLAGKYPVGQPATIACVDGVLRLIRPALS